MTEYAGPVSEGPVEELQALPDAAVDAGTPQPRATRHPVPVAGLAFGSVGADPTPAPASSRTSSAASVQPIAPLRLSFPIPERVSPTTNIWQAQEVTDLRTLRALLEKHFVPIFSRLGQARELPRLGSRGTQPQLFIHKLHNAVVHCLVLGQDERMVQQAWNMIESARRAPFKPDETRHAPLPQVPADAKRPDQARGTWLDFYTVYSKEAVGEAVTKLTQFLISTKSVQRHQFVPGGWFGDYLLKNGPNTLAWLTAARKAGNLEEADNMANIVQGHINLMIDAINKAQHNVRVWAAEGEGETEEGTVVGEREMGLRLIELSKQLGATRRRATLVHDDYDALKRRRAAEQAALKQPAAPESQPTHAASASPSSSASSSTTSASLAPTTNTG